MELESDNSADFMDDEEDPGIERFDDQDEDDFNIEQAPRAAYPQDPGE
jgi:hypothetical protein